MRIISRTVSISILLGLLFGTNVVAQGVWDGPFKNLQVFPSDVSGQQLRSAMQGFTRALGVRCEYCHDDSKGSSFRDMDFASELKPVKATTRIMMRMTQNANQEFLASLSSSSGETVSINCSTCHRGVAIPKPLGQILAEIDEKSGVEAALDEYDALRERYYGAAAYDFSPGTLNRIGYQLLSEERVDDAIRVFHKNAEVYPEESSVFDSLGEGYLAKGIKALALTYFQKALLLNPNNENARDQLNELLKSAVETNH